MDDIQMLVDERDLMAALDRLDELDQEAKELLWYRRLSDALDQNIKARLGGEQTRH